MITVVGKIDYKALHLIIECVKTRKPVMFCVEHDKMFCGIEKLLQTNGCVYNGNGQDNACKIIFVDEFGAYTKLNDEQADKVLDATPDIVLIKNITKTEIKSFGTLIEHVFEIIDIEQNLVRFSFYAEDLGSACDVVYSLLELKIINGFIKPKVFLPYKRKFFELDELKHPINKYFCPFNVISDQIDRKKEPIERNRVHHDKINNVNSNAESSGDSSGY